MANDDTPKAPKVGKAVQAGRTSAEEDPWISRTGDVKRFVQQRADYEHLANEVAYSLVKLLEGEGIKVVAVTSRAKTLESFLEKIERKSYRDPFSEVTDFAGVRIVCYYPDHIDRIGAIIAKEFVIVSSEDKISTKGIDQFGYSAKHYLVKLGQGAKGARYDAVKNLVCEIQVRTVLQDAWAVFSHHLMYKHEDDIPGVVKRQLNGLAGLLETADTVFCTIRDERDRYIQSVKASTKSHQLEEVELNLDSLATWLKSLPGRNSLEYVPGHLAFVLSLLQRLGYKAILDVQHLLQSSEPALAFLGTLLKRITPMELQPRSKQLFEAIMLHHPAMLDDPEVIRRTPYGLHVREAFHEARKKLK